MGTEQEDDLWAVITTSAGKYLLGNIKEVNEEKERALEKFVAGTPLELCPAYDLNVQMIPIPTPAGMQIQREVNACPYILTLADAPLFVKASAIQFFGDMKEGDRGRYKKLVEQASQMAKAARATDAGIEIAGAGDLPPTQER